MKKVQHLLWLAIGYIATGVAKIFGQFEEFERVAEPDHHEIMTVGLTSTPPPTFMEQIVRTSAWVITIVAPIIGVWIFLKKTAKKQPPMSTIKKILLSIAIFLWIFIIFWFLCSLTVWLMRNFIFSV